MDPVTAQSDASRVNSELAARQTGMAFRAGVFG